MKKSLFISLPVVIAMVWGSHTVLAASDVTINEQNFPDERVRNVVTRFDTSGDGKLSQDELDAVTDITLGNAVSDLEGLKYFKNLESAYIVYNCGTDGNLPDLSQIRGVKSLWLNMDYSMSGEVLSFEDVPNLRYLMFKSYNGAVDLSALTSLETLEIENRNDVPDLSGVTSLKKVTLWYMNCETVDLRANKALDEASFCQCENLTEVKMSAAKLTSLRFNSCTAMDVINVSKYTKLKKLYLNDLSENVTGLDLSKNTSLEELRIEGTGGIKSLDLSGVGSLTSVSITNSMIAPCGIENIILGNNDNIKSVSFQGDAISSLDLSGLGSLEQANLGFDLLTELKLPNSSSLKKLKCGNNKLTELDLSPYPYLEVLDCSKNNIGSLNISGNPFLIEIFRNWNKTEKDGIIGYKDEGSDHNYVYINGEYLKVPSLAEFKHDSSMSVEIGGIPITEEFFEDVALRNVLLSRNIDKNGNAYLEPFENEALTSLDISNRKVKSLRGIEHLLWLNSLNASHNELSGEFDYMLNTDVKEWDLSYNSYTSIHEGVMNFTADRLDISHNKLIDINGLDNCSVSYLDLSYNSLSEKTYLFVRGDIDVELIDLSNNSFTSMIHVVGSVSHIKKVDLSNNKIAALSLGAFVKNTDELHLENNLITGKIDLSNSLLPNTKIYLYDNRIEGIVLTGEYSTLYLTGGAEHKKIDGHDCLIIANYIVDNDIPISDLDVPLIPEVFPDQILLGYMKKYDKNGDGFLNISDSEKPWRAIDISNKGVKDLKGLEFFTVGEFYCEGNEIRELDLSKITAYTRVNCYNNPNLKKIILPEKSYMTDCVTKGEQTVEQNGDFEYICYHHPEYTNIMLNADKDVEFVIDSVKIDASLPFEGAGTISGTGVVSRGTEVTLQFTPSSGVVFYGWLKDGSLVSSELSYSFKTSADCSLTVLAKKTQSITFEPSSISKTYGDEPFTLSVKGAKTIVTYSSADPSICKIDSKTGKVTLTGKGTTTITAIAAAMDNYDSAEASIKIKVGAPTSTPTPKVSATPTVKITATPAPKPSVTPEATVTPEPTLIPSDPKTQILAFVERIYIYVLDREPEAEGAAFWSDELYSFRRTGAEVAQGFIFSDEFINRNTTDKEFVTILYKTFFGREPEEEGFNYWVGELASGAKDRVTVANGFIYSQEWADTCASYGIRSGGDLKPSGAIEPTELTYAFVERMYTTALGRGYDEEGKQYWASELANFNITGESVGAFFFLSDEMNGYGLSDQEYLNRLYATFMNREPDADGAAYWLSVLGSGTPRADVVFGFTRSLEFTEKCVEARILPY